MITAMYMLAFAAFLRIGEITGSATQPDKHLLQLSNFSFDSKNSITITFYSFKHSKLTCPFCINILNLPGVPVVSGLKDYLELRGNVPGPLFNFNAKPVSRSAFLEMLNQCLQFHGLKRGHILHTVFV